MGRPQWGAVHPARTGERAEVLRVGRWMPSELRRGATGHAPLSAGSCYWPIPGESTCTGSPARRGAKAGTDHAWSRSVRTALPVCRLDGTAMLRGSRSSCPRRRRAPVAPAGGPDPVEIFSALPDDARREMAQRIAVRSINRSPQRYLDAGRTWGRLELQALIQELRQRGLLPDRPIPEPAKLAALRYIVPVVVELTPLAAEPLLDDVARGYLVELIRDCRSTDADPGRVSLRRIERWQEERLIDGWDPRPSVHRLCSLKPDDQPRCENWSAAQHIREDLARQGWLPESDSAEPDPVGRSLVDRAAYDLAERLDMPEDRR